MGYNSVYSSVVVLGVIIIISIAVILYMYFKPVKSNEQYSNKDIMDGISEESSKPKSKCRIVLYYSDSCGHCKMFMPTWKQFEGYASSNLPEVQVVTTSCDADGGKSCFENGIEGYPTVIIYPIDGRQVMFDKNRTLEDLVQFVKENTK